MRGAVPGSPAPRGRSDPSAAPLAGGPGGAWVRRDAPRPAPVAAARGAPRVRGPRYSAALARAAFFASHSATERRGTSIRSRVRVYQPRPCMRPTRSSFGVST